MSEPLCKNADDLATWAWLERQRTYQLDDEEFREMSADLGADGAVKLFGCSDPDMAVKDRLGLIGWATLQYDAPDEMDAQIGCLGENAKVQCALLCKSRRFTGVSITMSSFDDSVSPARYRDKSFSWLRPMITDLKGAGLICGVHAHGSKLRSYAPFVVELGFDFVESYTPPPYSDLSLGEARRIWGEDTVIQINFPESVFYEGYQGVLS